MAKITSNWMKPMIICTGRMLNGVDNEGVWLRVIVMIYYKVSMWGGISSPLVPLCLFPFTYHLYSKYKT